jgi:LPXTG-motif cell wall-anchored protein
MKIAKKVLALVMAVAMIASLSAMAFAADGTTLKLVAEKTAKGYTVTLVAENAEGLETVDGTLTYDATVLQAPKKVSDGAFVDAYKEIGESCSSAYNLDNAGEVIVGIAIAKSIYSDADYAKLVEEFQVEDAASITTDSLELCSLKFTVLDADAKDVKITYTDKKTGAVASVVLNETVVEPETTTAPVAPTDPNAPTEPVVPTEPSSEKADDDDKKTTDVVTPDDTKGNKGDKADGDDITGNAVPTDVNKNTNGNKTTGDNMALAAAASIVVLAGAAFVFTKKRK